MPANKNKLLRMSVFIEMLRRHARPNYTRFIEEMKRRDPARQYKLAQKTFLRDIRDLQEEFGAPIDYDSSERGFFLRDNEWCFESLMVEPFEMKGIILGQKAAEALMPETIRAEFNKAVRSLLTRNPAGLHDNADMEMMQIINPLQLPLSAEVFSAVFKGWERRHKLQLTYCSSRGTKHEMEFEPHVLAWQSGMWYLKGKVYDTTQSAGEKYPGSVLAVHRISEAKMLPLSFERNPQILEGVKNGQLFDFARYPEVRLQFPADLALRVRERFPASQIEEAAAGSLQVTLHNLTEYQVGELAVWAWGKIKVLSPDELRQEIIDFGNILLKNQNGE